MLIMMFCSTTLLRGAIAILKHTCLDFLLLGTVHDDQAFLGHQRRLDVVLGVDTVHGSAPRPLLSNIGTVIVGTDLCVVVVVGLRS